MTGVPIFWEQFVVDTNQLHAPTCPPASFPKLKHLILLLTNHPRSFLMAVVLPAGQKLALASG